MINKLIFEFGDDLYLLKGSNLEEIENFSDVPGDKWVISDFGGAPPQMMRIDAPAKYAEPVLERRLRHIGEMDGEGRVFCHFRRKVTVQMSEAFFTAVPADVYNRYEVAEGNDDDLTLLFPSNALLMRALLSIRPRKPAAVLLIHGNNVDIVVGDSGRVYGASRVSTYGEEVNTQDLTDNVVNALRTIEQDNHVKVDRMHCYHWLLPDPGEVDWVMNAAKTMEARCYIAKSKKISTGLGSYYSSIPQLAGKLTVSDAASGAEQKNRYRAQRALPWVAVVLVAATAALGWMSLNWQMKTANIENEIKVLQSGINKSMPNRRKAEQNVSGERSISVLKASYKEPLELAGKLYQAHKTPSIQTVLGHLSESTHGKVVFNKVEVDYPEGKVALKLDGKVHKSFENGINNYNAFLATLAGFGYKLTESKVETKSNGLAIKLELEKQIDEK